MAVNYSHINNCGSFPTAEKSALIKTFREVEEGTVVVQTSPDIGASFAELSDAYDAVAAVVAALEAAGVFEAS